MSYLRANVKNCDGHLLIVISNIQSSKTTTEDHDPCKYYFNFIMS